MTTPNFQTVKLWFVFQTYANRPRPGFKVHKVGVQKETDFVEMGFAMCTISTDFQKQSQRDLLPMWLSDSWQLSVNSRQGWTM